MQFLQDEFVNIAQSDAFSFIPKKYLAVALKSDFLQVFDILSITENEFKIYYRNKHLLCIFTFQHTHPKNWFLPWAGLEPTSPWLLVGHAKPLHHQGYHAGNAAD